MRQFGGQRGGGQRGGRVQGGPRRGGGQNRFRGGNRPIQTGNRPQGGNRGQRGNRGQNINRSQSQRPQQVAPRRPRSGFKQGGLNKPNQPRRRPPPSQRQPRPQGQQGQKPQVIRDLQQKQGKQVFRRTGGKKEAKKGPRQNQKIDPEVLQLAKEIMKKKQLEKRLDDYWQKPGTGAQLSDKVNLEEAYGLKK